MAIELFEDFFRIVCFFFFVLIVFRQLYTKVFPYLAELYQKYKHFIADKIKLREKISKHKETVLHEIEKQHEQGLLLNKKVTLWAERERSYRDKKNQEEQQSQEMLKNYMVEQSQSLAFTIARKDLMPEITHKVTEEIHVLYSSSDQQKNYIAKIIDSLESNNNE